MEGAGSETLLPFMPLLHPGICLPACEAHWATAVSSRGPFLLHRWASAGLAVSPRLPGPLGSSQWPHGQWQGAPCEAATFS